MSTARDLVQALHDSDAVSASLGISIDSVEAGRVALRMPVADAMANGHGLVHGGYLFLLADTAFAYSCVSLGRPSVTRTADIAFLAPGRAGSELVARAEARTEAGRTTIVDVRVTQGDELLAEFRGHGTLVSR
ncbi:MAG: hypothetical protein BGO97_02930 [Micrococcales bacterium 70-64]|nr:hotdog fold thioesterase [Leifsonia sp.]ODU66144.1 MAG: hypothetical protein ABT06_02935 [Leifsonia sp. SCN 70-46]OJX84770.1 MAG: hypothetical protein BGO97_02930 [Micrococcales bacterium 70-64]